MRAAVLASILLAACATAADEPRPLRDQALATALLGAWCNSEDGGKTCWAYDHFTPDGMLRACGRFPDERQVFDGTGVVAVTGDVMCYRVTRATANFWVKPGSTYCTRIVGISGSAHAYQDMESGATFRLLRVPVASITCPPAPE